MQGRNTPSIHSKDLLTWTKGPEANAATPDWLAEAVPLNRGNGFWAPDVIKIAGRYVVFFSASSFGKNTSAIGVTSNATLDPADPAYKWEPGGLVIQSKENDDFNCIDPAAFLGADGKLWLSFGSFWSGIKLIELDPATCKRISPDAPIYSIAHWDSIEAPYIYQHGDRYYLFASYGLCCRGANSTYHTRVGRADKITGPYLDKNGRDMLLGGGTTVITSEGPFIGPGHAGILEENGHAWFTCHFYDQSANGASKLAIRPLTWTPDGWPQIEKPKE